MIQDTVARTGGVAGVGPAVVVCNEAQASIVVAQLDSMGAPPQAVVVEPVGRNTGPAVAAAALLIEPEIVMAVFPADHVIGDLAGFERAFLAAVEAAQQGAVVVFGVSPTRPDTGFGYLEIGTGAEVVSDLRRFVEKPDPERARQLVDAGCLWNSGMFVFQAGVILDELAIHAPEVLQGVTDALGEATRRGIEIGLGPSFASVPSISIDHAVMEKTDRGKVVLLDAGWSDVGTWQALFEAASPDGANFSVGPVHLTDVHRSYVRAESRPVAVIGLDDVVVVETPDAVLVMDRRRAQDVRLAAEWFAAPAEDG